MKSNKKEKTLPVPEAFLDRMLVLCRIGVTYYLLGNKIDDSLKEDVANLWSSANKILDKRWKMLSVHSKKRFTLALAEIYKSYRKKRISRDKAHDAIKELVLNHQTVVQRPHKISQEPSISVDAVLEILFGGLDKDSYNNVDAGVAATITAGKIFGFCPETFRRKMKNNIKAKDGLPEFWFTQGYFLAFLSGFVGGLRGKQLFAECRAHYETLDGAIQDTEAKHRGKLPQNSTKTP